MIWMNRASHNVLQIFGKIILIPAVFAFGLLAYELYLTPVPDDTSTTYILLVHDYGKNIANMSLIVDWAAHPPVSGYWLLYGTAAKIRINPLPGKLSEEEARSFYLDLVEAVFWKWLFQNYCGHWDVDRMSFHGISSWSGQTKPAEESEPDPLQQSWHDIAARFPDNRILPIIIKDSPTIGTRWESFVKFPHKTTISPIRQDNLRGVSFSNRYIKDFRCTISWGKEEKLNSSEFGKKIKEILSSKTGKEYTTAYFFEVQFVISYNPSFRWSPSTIKQKAWATDMMKTFQNDFDWEIVRRALLKS